jgi:broad specificity phosphatase PhoE
MRPRRIILIRHAQSEANNDPKVYIEKPDHRHGLTSEGKAQAMKAGERLAGLLKSDPFGVFVSPYLRTIQTANIALTVLQRPPQFLNQDPRLREQDYGLMQSVEENQQRRQERALYGRFFYRFPGGESGADVFDRMSAFLETLHRRFEDDQFPPNILLFTHGFAMKCFLMRWHHWTVDQFEQLPENIAHCHMVVMTKADCPDGYRPSEPFGPLLLPDSMPHE